MQKKIHNIHNHKVIFNGYTIMPYETVILDEQYNVTTEAVVDLSPYLKKDELDLDEYLKKSEISTYLSAYATKQYIDDKCK